MFFVHLCQEKHFAAGERIFEEGSVGDCLYLIGSGEVEISRRSGGKKEILSSFGPGSFFGEMALIDDGPRSADADAFTAVDAAVISRAMFEDMMQASPVVVSKTLIKISTLRLRQSNQQFLEERLRQERLSVLGSMANSIVHDLRTPLGVTRMVIELIRPKLESPDDLELAEAGLRASDDVLEMIQELLDFSRGNTQTTLVPTPFRELYNAYRQRIDRLLKHSAIVLKAPEPPDWVLSLDQPRFLRVLLNLTKNAVEAMPSGGKIEWCFTETDDVREMRLSDSGPGIAPEKLSRVFEPFFTSGKSQGTGLGLAISRSVVEAHGGRIWLESVVDQGTTAVIQLPKTHR
ncbi:MAG: ATP-binding protein [Verrucomicrobiales bacterium]